jgi:hypothetical protein
MDNRRSEKLIWAFTSGEHCNCLDIIYSLHHLFLIKNKLLILMF